LVLLRDRERGLRKSEVLEWELRHSPSGPPSASCFHVILALYRQAREARADCCRADCTELYKSGRIAGQTTYFGSSSRKTPPTVRLTRTRTVSGVRSALSSKRPMSPIPGSFLPKSGAGNDGFSDFGKVKPDT
jgi:hypothetical protein